MSVGFPLLVHRRCQSPMFDICNKIAYDNKMIFAAAKSDSYLTTILKKSRWIDVQDDQTRKSQYESEAEFKELFKLLKPVFEQDNVTHLLDQIYIITMYKNYSSYIKFKLKQEAYKLRIENKINNFCTNNIGTIHAFQGKEADTVIMVLGAQHSEDWGARNIMTEKPNVLNVGISRAKNNLYVIGNAEIWQKHKYMQDIYNMLGN
ncbi:MAG TPA: AAA domain-containing protein [Rickettsia endosymbiont of Pyrocoelia pectoralis]|nr:AAA domain-containing protein [Rickettsia endosymbiont of Pyrocoelia pectoralis]